MSTATASPEPLVLVVLHAGVSEPSTTQMLAERVAAKVQATLVERERSVDVVQVALAPMAADITQALVSGVRSERLEAQMALLARADGMVATTPVYTAGVSGLFKSFMDLLDSDLIIALPVVIATTAGSPRHALVADDHLRPLFAYLRALTMPTSLSAGPDDWRSPAFSQRIDRAASELAVLMEVGARRLILRDNWSRHEHRFDGVANHATGTEDVDFDTDLMRLAVGAMPLSHPDDGPSGPR